MNDSLELDKYIDFKREYRVVPINCINENMQQNVTALNFADAQWAMCLLWFLRSVNRPMT